MGALKMLAASLAALGCTAAAAAPAAAQSPPPTGLEVRLAVPATEAKLGDVVKVKVTVANTSAKVLSIINPEFDFQSVSLRLQWREPAPAAAPRTDTPPAKDGIQEPPPPPVPAPAPPEGEGEEPKAPPAKPDPRGRLREARIERFVPGFQRPKQTDTRQLPPGESMSIEIDVPMMFTGAVRLEALYNGFGLASLLSVPVSGAPLVSDPHVIQVAGTPKRQIGCVMTTPHGAIELELWPHLAPNHVFNFLSLAHAGFFDDSFIPRIMKGFVVQGGSPENHAAGTPGWSIPGEFNEVLHTRGILSMARGQNPFTAGSQFFICLADCPQLDPAQNRGMGYTVFGKMIAGDDTLTKLENLPVVPSRMGERKPFAR
ncbi:MAG: peptidylprolyl isomerase [Planctomycetota bacterium]